MTELSDSSLFESMTSNIDRRLSGLSITDYDSHVFNKKIRLKEELF